MQTAPAALLLAASSLASAQPGDLAGLSAWTASWISDPKASPFSLWWIAMVHDYWMLRDDQPFVRARMQGVRSVLDWFENHVDESGLVGPMPWWNYLDWAKNYPNGIPPGGRRGHATAFSLQFVIALQQASELEQDLGRPAEAERCRELASRLIDMLRAKAWDADRGLFADSLDSRVCGAVRPWRCEAGKTPLPVLRDASSHRNHQ